MLNKPIQKGISVISVCKNRNHHIEKMLASVVDFEQIDEVVVVDWSSDEPLKPVIEQFNRDNIVLAQVPDQDEFLRCHALNLAARLTTRDTLLKLDADVLVTSDFFSDYPLPDKSFYAGKYELARNRNEYALSGLLYIKREDFFKANGYNEYLTTWGVDDIDLFQRLTAVGLNWIGIDYNYFYHIPHGGRFSNLPALYDGLGLSDRDLEAILGEQTAFIARECAWDHRNEMTDYHVFQVEQGLLKCVPVDIHANVISPEILSRANKYSLIKLINKFLDTNESIYEGYTEFELMVIYDKFLKNKDSEFLDKYLQYISKGSGIGPKESEIIAKIKSSYSWKIGNTIVRAFFFLFGWLPRVRKKIQDR